MQQAKQQGAHPDLIEAYEKFLNDPNIFQLRVQQLCEFNTIVASNDKRKRNAWIFTVTTNPAHHDKVVFYYTEGNGYYTVDSITGLSNLLLHTSAVYTNSPTSQSLSSD
jgi:hypothetical protein